MTALALPALIDLPIYWTGAPEDCAAPFILPTPATYTRPRPYNLTSRVLVAATAEVTVADVYGVKINIYKTKDTGDSFVRLADIAPIFGVICNATTSSLRTVGVKAVLAAGDIFDSVLKIDSSYGSSSSKYTKNNRCVCVNAKGLQGWVNASKKRKNTSKVFLKQLLECMK